MENKEKIKVAIAGAGLTGLTTAFYLKKAGIHFVVFEKAERPGGVIQTTTKTVLRLKADQIQESCRNQKWLNCWKI
jgi:protoporphyrinogen oxidase